MTRSLVTAYPSTNFPHYCLSQTFRLPGNPDSSVLGMSVEEVQGLVEQMSTGIVGVEVKVESQPITPSVPVVNFDDKTGTPSIGGVTIRQVGLWIRITEVEGKSLPHTTSIYTPILQLIVTGSGNKVEKIETLAIDGKAPIEQKAHHGLGPAMVESLPAVEGGPRRARPYDLNGELMKEPEHHHNSHHHPHHGHGEDEKRPSFGILGWIARTLDISRWGRPSRAGAHRPCHGRKGMMRGGNEAAKMNGETAPGKVVVHRPVLDNPFSGVADDDEGYESGTEARKELKHHMRPHYPSHKDGMPPHHGFSNKKHHGRCGNFFRRMAIGFVYGFAMLGAILMHPITLLSISALSALAVTFHAVRRIVIKKRQSAVRLGGEEEEGLLEDDKAPLMGEKEAETLKEVVVVEVEELPRYEERS